MKRDATVDRDHRPEPIVLRAIDRASALAAIVAGTALILLLINVAADVVTRTVTGRPLGRTLELTTFWWMPVMITLAYAITEREREHVTVTLLLDRLSRRTRQYVEGAFTALGTLLVLLLTLYAAMDAAHATDIRMAANSTPPLAYWPAKILAGVGLGLLALQLAASSYRHLSGRSRFTDDLATEADVV